MQLGDGHPADLHAGHPGILPGHPRHDQGRPTSSGAPAANSGRQLPAPQLPGRARRTTGSACGDPPIRSPRSRRPTRCAWSTPCGSRTSTGLAAGNARRTRQCGNADQPDRRRNGQHHLLGPAAPALSRRPRRADAERPPAPRPPRRLPARSALRLHRADRRPPDYRQTERGPTVSPIRRARPRPAYRLRRTTSITRWAIPTTRPRTGITSRSTTATSPAWPS